MAISGPVVLDFDVLEPVTMTIIASLGLSDINLAAIFNLLPVTNLVLPVGMHFQRKQGKIRIPPELNRPGEIMSMRWSGNVRWIVRSEKARSFPHSIIIDVGTTNQIVSLKLSRSIKFTTKRVSYAKEAYQIITDLLRRCQEDLNLIRS